MIEEDWLSRPIQLARSSGGVYAFKDPWQGLVCGGVQPWPPPELVQKLYKSRQSRAYAGENLGMATAAHGFYSDLQSMHAEDAVTWSVFGPLAYADPKVRSAYAAELLSCLLKEQQRAEATGIWLWRRIPHPETLVSGGPEIDFGIQTERVLLLGEAKWRSHVGAMQGVNRAKDQIELRVEFCEKHGRLIYPRVQQFVVLMVSQDGQTLTSRHREMGTDRVLVAETTWEKVGGLAGHPWRDEVLAHLKWRQDRSKPLA